MAHSDIVAKTLTKAIKEADGMNRGSRIYDKKLGRTTYEHILLSTGKLKTNVPERKTNIYRFKTKKMKL